MRARVRGNVPEGRGIAILSVALSFPVHSGKGLKKRQTQTDTMNLGDGSSLTLLLSLQPETTLFLLATAQGEGLSLLGSWR